MNNPLKQPLHEQRIFSERAAIALIIIAVVFGLILSRYFYLQVFKHQYFVQQAEKNRIKIKRLEPARGLIYDRNGTLLVDNKTAYRLTVVPEKTADLATSLQRLQTIIELTPEELAEIKKQDRFTLDFKTLVVKPKLSERQISLFAVNQHLFPGYQLEPYLIRQYHYPEIMSHVIGYVSKINAEEYAAKDSEIYAADDYIGKLGIEKYYEAELHGLPGQLRLETNAQGRKLSQTIAKAPVNGQQLNLTIDLRLQQATYEAFGEETGSAIVVNPNNGEILAMISKPGFNSNLFINGISHQAYRALLNNPQKPLFNRSIKGRYEPGSTIKPYIALAGLYHQIISPEFTMVSKGFFQLPNQKRKYHDWKRGGHGEVNVVDALAQSVNVFFYELAFKLGIDQIEQFLKPFKFGQLTGIDIAGEKKGILPSRTWKQKNRKRNWFPGETVITGIGQGYFVITPIQMAQALSILAAKGKIYPLHLVQKPITFQNLPYQIKAIDWQTVHQGMSEVVNTKKGTAYALRSEDYVFAGKSGTSQVFGKSEQEIYRKNRELPKHLRNHALFIAFAPLEQPQVAVVVIAEHGASGSKTAAPIARKIIDAYMQLDQPQTTLGEDNHEQ